MNFRFFFHNGQKDYQKYVEWKFLSTLLIDEEMKKKMFVKMSAFKETSSISSVFMILENNCCYAFLETLNRIDFNSAVMKV